MSLQYTKIHTVTGYTSGDYDIAFTFDYLDDTDIKVYKTDTSVAPLIYGTDWVFENKKTIKLLAASANFTIADNDVFQVQRETQISTSHVTFAPGSPVRAEDLNSNQLQSLYAAQEREDRGINKNGENDVTGRVIFRDNVLGFEGPTANDYETFFAAVEPTQDNTVTVPNITGTLITDADTETVTSQMILDGTIIDADINASADIDGSKLLDESITSSKIQNDTIVNSDINASANIDGSKIATNTINLNRINSDDIVTQSEQDDFPDNARTDNEIFTGLAATTRFDTIVSSDSQTIQSGSNYPTGKNWLNPSDDNAFKIYDGNNWQPVASGGDFTELNKVIYVDSTNGNNSKSGHRISGPKLTIKEALSDIAADPNGAGTTIILSPGVYREELPLTIPKDDVSIIGQGLRSCFIQPKLQGNDAVNYSVNNPTPSETTTMFLCRSGTLLQNITFVGMKASGARGSTANNNPDPDPTYGLPPNQGWCAGFVSGCVIRKSPYIQNCTSFNDSDIDNSQDYDPQNYTNSGGLGGDTDSDPTGGGILCDGSVPAANSPLRSFVVDSFTQVNLNGPGILCTNNAYAQLVSFFGTFCYYHAKSLNGGQLNLSNCTSDFGTYGLIADGKSTSAVITGQVVGSYAAGSPNNDPNTKVVLTVDNLASQGNFQTNQPGPTQLVTIGSQTYMILQATPVSNNTCDITLLNPNANQRNLDDGLIDAINNGVTASFYLQSYISTGGHTFEFVGSGTNYSAHPDFGGQAIAANQYKELGGTGTNSTFNGGKVWLSATDEEGNFKVGDTFAVDQKTGFVTIDPTSVASSVVSDLTPQLGGNLDLNNRDIEGTGNINITGNITATSFSGNGSGLTNVLSDLVGDTTPQLGGNLDVNGNDILSVNNGDVSIKPHGTGKTVIANDNFASNTQLGNGTSFHGDLEYLYDNGNAKTVILNSVGAGGNVSLRANGSERIKFSETGDVELTAPGTSLIQVTENNLSKVPIVTQHDIGTAANEIPLNQYLGTAAFQDSDNFSVGNLQIATAYTFATLPSSPSVGRVARVTDSTVTTWGGTVTGGGSNNVLCWYNGTNWTVIGV